MIYLSAHHFFPLYYSCRCISHIRFTQYFNEDSFRTTSSFARLPWIRKFQLTGVDDKSHVDSSPNQLRNKSYQSGLNRLRVLGMVQRQISEQKIKRFSTFEIFYFWPLLTQIAPWILDKGATSVRYFDQWCPICRLLRCGVCRWQCPVIGYAQAFLINLLRSV